MSALATSALSAQPGRRDDAASLPPETPGQSLRHHGRETTRILPGQDDPDHVTALTQRAERRHFEDYPARRTERGYTGTLDATLTRPFVIHYRARPPGLRPGRYTRIPTDPLPPDLHDALALIK